MSTTLPPALAEIQQRAVRALLEWTPDLLVLGELFDRAGRELAAVGGCVRDAVLHDFSHTDIDLTTDARPEEVLALVRDWADSVWDVGIRFGTIGLRRGGQNWEITTYRTDNYAEHSRKPEISFGSTLAEDLVRRDFTINSMAVRLPSGEFVDDHGGLIDLAARRLRTPGDPADSFSDDPLRMMRAARFVSQLDARVDPAAMSAMRDMADRLAIVSAERVRDELSRLLLGSSPRRGLEVMVDAGLADQVLPELPLLRLEIDEHHRHKDVYGHTLQVLEQAVELEDAGPDLVLRLAAVMHDVGKPRTRRFEPGGGVSFHHHEVVGARMTAKRLRRLRFGNEVVAEVARLVELHLRFHGYGTGEWTDAAVRRYVRDAGPLLPRLHKLTRADCTTRNRRRADALQRAYDGLERRIARLEVEEELAAIRPELDGNQIMSLLGIPPGRDVGRAYQFLLDLRLDGGLVGEAAAEEALLRWWSEQNSG